MARLACSHAMASVGERYSAIFLTCSIYECNIDNNVADFGVWKQLPLTKQDHFQT